MPHLLLVFITASLLATPVRPTPRAFGYASLRDGHRSCIAVPYPPLRAGEYVAVVVWRERPTILRGRVGRQTDSPCFAEGPDFQGTSYEIEVEGPLDDPNELALVVTQAFPPDRPWEGPPTLSVDSGLELSFKRCASTEGLHFTVWRGATRIWHGYFYVGYDLESDCTDEQTD